MLERKLARLIKIGRLTIVGLGTEPQVFGQIISSECRLDVVVRIRDRFTALKIGLWPELYLGEAYMDGSLTLEKGTLWDLLDLCGRNFSVGDWRRSPGRAIRIAQALARFFHQANSRRRAKRNVAHHYDLSDVLFRHFLDADRQYSCAYFRDPHASIEEAQLAKIIHIGTKLLLKPGMRVLDIGCGWGGLALALARFADVHVVGITLSGEQAAIARQRVRDAGLEDRVSIELKDYRDIQGPFDRIVSIGMFEHVGVPNYPIFFERLGALLADNGVALLHSIGRKDGPGTTGRWIRKYIFPGGYVPALSETIRVIETSGLWITDIEILRLHYAETLRHWRQRFLQHIGLVREMYDERFCRMWEFYLASCEMSFRYDNLMVFQMQLTKEVGAVPITRDYMFTTEAALHERVRRTSDAGTVAAVRWA